MLLIVSDPIHTLNVENEPDVTVFTQGGKGKGIEEGFGM